MYIVLCRLQDQRTGIPEDPEAMILKYLRLREWWYSVWNSINSHKWSCCSCLLYWLLENECRISRQIHGLTHCHLSYNPWKIFARDWSKNFTWLSMPELNLTGNIRVIFSNLKNIPRVAKRDWKNNNTIASIQRENMPPAGIFASVVL